MAERDRELDGVAPCQRQVGRALGLAIVYKDASWIKHVYNALHNRWNLVGSSHTRRDPSPRAEDAGGCKLRVLSVSKKRKPDLEAQT